LELYREALLKFNIGKRQIQFYDFELPENFVNRSWDDIYFDIKKKLQADKPNYIFLDEVQNIPHFEKIKDNYPKFLLTTDGFTQNRSGVIHLNVFNWLLERNENQ
jgi:hypothetical protein